jgi:ATP-dependent DNA helicase RecG
LKNHFLSVRIRLKKLHHKSHTAGNPFPIVGDYFNDFYENHLPFDLTGAQKRVLKEIRMDMKRPIQMNRLLQGDVGSGKTMVALLTMLIAKDNGFQSCIMAPTEILAQQHYNGIKELLEKTEVKIRLLTGSTKKSERNKIHEELENGELSILWELMPFWKIK